MCEYLRYEHESKQKSTSTIVEMQNRSFSKPPTLMKAFLSGITPMLHTPMIMAHQNTSPKYHAHVTPLNTAQAYTAEASYAPCVLRRQGVRSSSCAAQPPAGPSSIKKGHEFPPLRRLPLLGPSGLCDRTSLSCASSLSLST